MCIHIKIAVLSVVNKSNWIRARRSLPSISNSSHGKLNNQGKKIEGFTLSLAWQQSCTHAVRIAGETNQLLTGMLSRIPEAHHTIKINNIVNCERPLNSWRWKTVGWMRCLTNFPEKKITSTWYWAKLLDLHRMENTSSSNSHRKLNAVDENLIFICIWIGDLKHSPPKLGIHRQTGMGLLYRTLHIHSMLISIPPTPNRLDSLARFTIKSLSKILCNQNSLLVGMLLFVRVGIVNVWLVSSKLCFSRPHFGGLVCTKKKLVLHMGSVLLL